MIQQTVFLLVSQVIGRLLGFAVLLLLGNVLGSVELGAYGTMLTLLMIGTILSTFGLDLWLSRYAANNDIRTSDFKKILAIRLGLTFVLLSLGSLLFKKDVFLVSLNSFAGPLLLVLISIVFDHVSLTAQAVLEGKRNLKAVAWLILVRWGIFAIGASVVLSFAPSLEGFCFSFLAGALARSLAALYFVRRYLNPSANPIASGLMMTEAASMALLNTMVGLYFHIDMVMIPEMDSLAGAGFYKTAYTMVEALLFISGAVAAALYPVFSKNHLSFEQKWENLEVGVFLLLLLAFPIALCTHFVSVDMVKLMFLSGDRGVEFLPASSALNVLVWALPAMFTNINLVRLLLGLHRQKMALVGVTITAMTNIALNLWLIPKVGFMGAAYATVASESILTLFLLAYLVSTKHPITLWKPFIQPVLTGCVAYICAWFLRHQALWLIVFGTASFYVVFLFATKSVDLNMLRKFGKT